MADPGIDSAWPTRVPPGWVQFPDGSVGPPNKPSPIDQAWPTRLPNPGTSLPMPQGTPGGELMPGGGVNGLTGATPGAPSMGYPALGGGALRAPSGPQIIPPQGSNVGTGKEVGPRDWWAWEDADAPWTYRPSFSLSNLLGLLARGGPIPMAIRGMLASTPADTGELPRQTLGRKPSGPGAPVSRGIGSDANFPVMGASGFPTTYAAPGQQPPVPTAPAATTGVFNNPADSPVRPPPRPVIDPRHVDLGTYQNPRFTTFDRPNAPAAGNARGGGGPLTMGMLDLSRLFKKGQS